MARLSQFDVVYADHQEDACIGILTVLQLAQGELDFPVIVDFEHVVTEVLAICHPLVLFELPVALINLHYRLAISRHDDALRNELGRFRFNKWVVGHCKGDVFKCV